MRLPRSEYRRGFLLSSNSSRRTRMRLGRRLDGAVAGLAAVGLMGAPVAPARFDGGAVGGNGAGEKHGGPQGWGRGRAGPYEKFAGVPVRSKSNADTGEFETLDEGLASGDVLVTEHGASDYLRRSREGDALPAPQQGGGAEVN